MQNNDPRKILLVQLYSNGDCLYATAVARQIKTDFPGCHLTWAIAAFCQHIIDNNPYVDDKLIITDIKRDDVTAFRKLKRRLNQERNAGKWHEVFVTMNMDSNLALYDGTIRGMILRAYPGPITVPLQPVLVLSAEEIKNVKTFISHHSIDKFKNVVLWEYAPQSGQMKLDHASVHRVAKRIASESSTCFILSSANKFESSENVIDASSLTLRENAALTHYCTLLIGCSSGITWISTSSAGRMLPMIQLLDAYTAFRNAPSVDFERFNIVSAGLIEMLDFNEDDLAGCIRMVISGEFNSAKNRFNQPLPVQFNTTRKVVYNLLCYMQFGAIAKHFQVTREKYGLPPAFLREFTMAITSFPIKLLKNIYRKKIKRSNAQ